MKRSASANSAWLKSVQRYPAGVLAVVAGVATDVTGAVGGGVTVAVAYYASCPKGTRDFLCEIPGRAVRSLRFPSGLSLFMAPVAHPEALINAFDK